MPFPHIETAQAFVALELKRLFASTLLPNYCSLSAVYINAASQYLDRFPKISQSITEEIAHAEDRFPSLLLCFQKRLFRAKSPFSFHALAVFLRISLPVMPKVASERPIKRSNPYPTSHGNGKLSLSNRILNPIEPPMSRNAIPQATSVAPLWTPITPSSTANLLPPIITSNFNGIDHHNRTPSNSSSPWSGHDDDILTSARSQSLGWAQIQKDHFPTKTPNACRKRYERLVAKKRSHDWDQERIERLAAHYLELREQIWKPLAQVIGESWEEVEKKVGFKRYPCPWNSTEMVSG